MQTKALFLFNLLMCVAQMHPLFSGLSFVYHFKNDKKIQKENTRKTWNIDFIILCQNLIGLPEFEAKLFFCVCLYDLAFYLETIGVR